MSASTETLRRDRLAAVLAIAATRLPAERMAMFESCLLYTSPSPRD